MDKNEAKFAKNPRQNASLLSILTFKWVFPTYSKGFKRELEVTDLFAPLHDHESRNLGNKMSRLWKEEEDRCRKLKKKSEPSLFRVLVRCFGWDVLFFGLFVAFLEFVVKSTQPIILSNLLRYFSSEHSIDRIEALYWGTGIILGLTLDIIITHSTLQGLMHMGMKVRVACCSLIYRKILSISKIATGDETNVGQMINLLSNDVNRMDYSVFTLHYIWIAPIQTALISYLLYREVQMAAAGAIFTLLLFLPIHGLFGKITSYVTTKLANRTDERLRLTNQIINGVKVIKMYAWEKPFANLIYKAREREVNVIRNSMMAAELNWSFEIYVPRLCIFITVLGYILFGNDIDAEKVYLITAYFNVLRTTLYREFPLGIMEISQALVSVKRLQKFLLLQEIEYKSFIKDNQVNTGTNDEAALSFNDVTVKWSPESKAEALKHISLNVERKSLTAIIGQVGSGKTTILHTILREIPISNGQLEVNGKVSYASQEAWLFASSIRQNILFGKPMDKERYEKVIEVCQLKCDFQILPFGDSTLVGERGKNLSGGQCARVNLARAIYHDADIYLLDDPLSAVDTRVGKGIFEECIKTFLKHKTVILVTHQLHFLKHVDRIIILNNGAIQAQGTYDDLNNSGLDLKGIMKYVDQPNEIPDDIATPLEDRTVSEANEMNLEQEEQSESRTVGRMSAKTYYQYLKAAGSGFFVCFVFLITVSCEISSTGSDYFMSYWVNLEENGNITSIDDNDPFRGRSWYVIFYGCATAAMIFLTLCQIFAFFQMCMRISRTLHAMIFNSIIRTKMAFFNANPAGRIMNRFSKDTGIIDSKIPQTIIAIVTIALNTVAVLFLVIKVNTWFTISIAIIAVVIYFYRRFYIRGSRSIKRLEGITRSPVFNHLSDTFHGLTTIRALGSQKILIKEFDSHQDLHSSAWFLFISGTRAFGMYTDLLCMLFTASVTYTLIAIDIIPMAGDAGLIITQCLLLTSTLQWGVRLSAELENQMTSVERVLEYSVLPEEPLLEKAPINISGDWPERGEIIFKDVSLTYDRQEKPSLKNLNFTIEPEQMIGIVGRTGAGKSSLITALFRLADIEGEILIDGIDTSKVSLQNLRSKISIIPQEPVLFSGSLRRNLDPFEEYSDHDLWSALENVEMKMFIDSDLGLDMKVMEGGSNFSVGQRQLLCMARAIIRNSKILVLDEATANVDPRTDELIQEAVRRKFGRCTVLIVAHRLNTVMDCDKILVMDAGQNAEFDHPHNLLQRPNGVFYNMVQQAGATNLFDIARINYEKSQKVDAIKP